MPITIRPGGFDDVPAILVIEHASPGAAHWTTEQYDKLLNGGVVLVAEVAGQPCGFICAQIVGDEWEIENAAVKPEFLRRGIANALVSELIQRSGNAPASAIFLEVRESNFPARALYEKHGFCEVGRRRVYYKAPLEDAILYSLRLNRAT